MPPNEETIGKPIDKNTNRTSDKYGFVQTVILCAFAGLYFLDASPRFFVSGMLESVGAVLCAVGLFIMLSAFVSIGGAIQIAPEPRPGGKLVTSGIYKVLRHPIYTAILIVVAGLFFRKPTVPIFVATSVVIAFLIVKSRFEEKLLLRRYPEYADYKRRTWGIAPQFRRAPSKVPQDVDDSIK